MRFAKDLNKSTNWMIWEKAVDKFRNTSYELDGNVMTEVELDLTFKKLFKMLKELERFHKKKLKD